MIAYFENLSEGEQLQLTQVIQGLLRQTFFLERKYEKNPGSL